MAGLFTLLGVHLLGRLKGALAAALAIGFYALLVGPGASIWRAALMGCIGLLGQQIGRRQEGLNTLAFTAALMCWYDSNYLWDVGFQLSFAATLGLVLYAGRPGWQEHSYLLILEASDLDADTLPGLVAGVRPQLTVINANGIKSGQSPDPQNILALAGYSLLRTDQNGWIEVSTDGERMWVRVEKK